jgi:hypothetical protein
MSCSFQAGAFNFALPVPFKRSSIVVLEAAADGLQFVTNVTPGRLAGTHICTQHCASSGYSTYYYYYY